MFTLDPMVFTCVTERENPGGGLSDHRTQHQARSPQEAAEQAAACVYFAGSKIRSVRVFTQDPEVYDVNQVKFSAVKR